MDTKKVRSAPKLQTVVSELTPASYKLVGLQVGIREVFVPIMARSYSTTELLRPDLAELLHRLGWPHIEKNQAK